MLDRTHTAAQIVVDHPACAAVFKRHRIEFCCGASRGIAAAAEERGLDVETLIAELEAVIAHRAPQLDGSTQQAQPPNDPQRLSTPRLLAYIVSKHHEYLRKELPSVQQLATKVERVHGDHNPKLHDLAVAVTELAGSLLRHLDEEEEILFPALAAKAPGAKVEALLETMTVEHLAVARLLERIRRASDDLTWPEWACGSYRALVSGLRDVESDIFTHVHLENHVLAPRFARQS